MQCDADLSRHKIVQQRHWDACANTISDRISTSVSVRLVSSLHTQEFPRFQELPIELRFHIWRMALPGPRALHLKTGCYYPTRPDTLVEIDGEILFNHVPHDSPRFGFRSPSTMPVLLACRESYRIGASVYTKAFGSDSAFPETWFDFEQDTLYLDWDSPILNVGDIYDAPMPTHAGQVQHLAILHCPDWYQSPRYLHRVLRRFGNVKTFSMIMKRHCCEFDNLALMDPFDFDAKVDLLESPDDEILEEKYNQDQNRYLGEAFNAMELDTHTLKNLWRRGINSDGIPAYNMPTIAVKIMTTRGLKEAFEIADCQYLKNKGRFHGPRRSMISVVCQTRYAREYHFLVTSATPVSQIMQSIRDINHQSSYIIEVFLAFDGAWLDSSSLVGNLGLESHDRLDIYMELKPVLHTGAAL